MKTTNDMCANMAFNEGKEDVRASPMLRAGKRHKGGIIVPRKPGKARTQRWVLKAKAKWQAKRGPLKYSKQYILIQQRRLDRRTSRRQARVVKLEVARRQEIENMQPGERLWSKQILEASENTLQAKHSEEAGVHYGPSGGLERQGKLHVPWPLRAVAIPFDDDLMQESDDEDLAGDDDDEEEARYQQQQQAQAQAPPRQSSRQAAMACRP